jgi:uncharacterized protein (TIRG00374 family)
MSRASLALRLGGLLVFLGIAFWTLDLHGFVGAFAELTGIGIIGAAVSALLTSSLGALRWGVLLSAIGRLPSIGAVTAATFIGSALNTLLPTGVAGDLVKVFAISNQQGASLSELLGTVAVDRMLGLAGFICIAFMVLSLNLPEGSTLVISPGLLGLGCMIGICLAFALVALDQWIPAKRSIWRRTLAALANLLYTVFGYRRHASALISGLLISLLAVFCVCGAIWLLALPFATISPAYVVLAVTAGALVSLLPLTVNGLGTRELVFVFVLGNSGLAPEQAVALSLAWFAITLIVAAALGGISVCLFPRLLLSPEGLRAKVQERYRVSHS